MTAFDVSFQNFPSNGIKDSLKHLEGKFIIVLGEGKDNYDNQ